MQILFPLINYWDQVRRSWGVNRWLRVGIMWCWLVGTMILQPHGILGRKFFSDFLWILGKLFHNFLVLLFWYVLILHISNRLWLSNKLLLVYHKLMTDKPMIIILIKRQTIVLCNVWRLAHIQFMHYRKYQPSVFEYGLLTLLHNCFFMIAEQ